jgi:hypothetical protein
VLKALNQSTPYALPLMVAFDKQTLQHGSLLSVPSSTPQHAYNLAIVYRDQNRRCCNYPRNRRSMLLLWRPRVLKWTQEFVLFRGRCKGEIVFTVGVCDELAHPHSIALAIVTDCYHVAPFLSMKQITYHTPGSKR